ncbi:MAG: hypothetical protein HQL81_05525 [Magnetococcales bacterium]|nr:hypothetical protein [Magnetococcales bacterium]
MSSGNQPEKTYRNWYLRWGGAWQEDPSKLNLKDGAGTAFTMPLFPPYYSYLLKLAPGVGLVDLYPWLAELIFFSIAVDGDNAGNVQESRAPLNMVSIFVDDNSDNVAFSRLNAQRRNSEDPIQELIQPEDDKNCPPLFPSCSPKLFMVDTFGQFKDTTLDAYELSQGGENYTTSRLVGAGNPMQMMRRFSVIGELSLEKKKRKVFHKMDLGKLNCFVINSISNLYRSMGVRDAMLLVRAMMEQGVWKSSGEKEKADDKKMKLIDNKGMLFAILHDRVFPEADTSYIETFFDGVISFEKMKDSVQKTCFRFERFPPPVPRQQQPQLTHNFWTYEVKDDGQLEVTFKKRQQ